MYAIPYDSGPPTDAICTNCDTRCDECTGGTNTDCTNCATGYSRATSSSPCEPIVCDPGAYLDGSSCLLCHNTCETCTGPLNTECTSCGSHPSNSFINLFLLDNSPSMECVESCGAYKFGNVSNHMCEDCFPGCQECTGATGLDCTSCDTMLGYVLNQGTCCPTSSQYFDGAACQPCDGSCLTCFNSASECQSCHSGQYLSGTRCVLGENCGVGFYPNINNQMCSSCDSSCHDCEVDSTPEVCTACPDRAGGSSQTYLSILGELPNTGECIENCPPGFYGAFLGPFSVQIALCKACDSSCETCALGSSFDCLSCPTGKYLNPTIGSSGPCVDICSGTTFMNTSSFVCDPCPAICTGCSDGLCTGCNSFRLFVNGICTNDCVEGYYFNGDECLICESDCASCDPLRPDKCLTCSGGLAPIDELCSLQ